MGWAGGTAGSGAWTAGAAQRLPASGAARCPKRPAEPISLAQQLPGRRLTLPRRLLGRQQQRSSSTRRVSSWPPTRLHHSEHVGVHRPSGAAQRIEGIVNLHGAAGVHSCLCSMHAARRQAGRRQGRGCVAGAVSPSRDVHTLDSPGPRPSAASRSAASSISCCSRLPRMRMTAGAAGLGAGGAGTNNQQARHQHAGSAGVAEWQHMLRCCFTVAAFGAAQAGVIGGTQAGSRHGRATEPAAAPSGRHCPCSTRPDPEACLCCAV